MNLYEPELGQMAYGGPWGKHAIPRFVGALLRDILNDLAMVYWNANQRSFEDAQWDEGFDIGIPGIEYRPYRAPHVAPDLPNFRFEDVSIYWYKHPGRGLSCNRELDKLSWIDWFDRCLDTMHKFDRDQFEKKFGRFEPPETGA